MTLPLAPVARLPERDHFAAVVTHAQVHMRELGCGAAAAPLAVGPSVRDFVHGTGVVVDGRYDRQVRAFGPEGQAVLERMSVAIVGLGGTGSIVAQQLAHLGGGRLLLIDHDEFDMSNLNRLQGAMPAMSARPRWWSPRARSQLSTRGPRARP